MPANTAAAPTGTRPPHGFDLAVACSGGRDSTALLHCVTRQARQQGLRVLALHVHHGLHAAADHGLSSIASQARRWGAGFAATRLASHPPAGASIEAWARGERYAALAQMAAQQGVGHVLLAHHQRDQAETWLLLALRGTGAAALAAMPAQRGGHGVQWLRPWLNQPRSAIEAYVARHRLGFVDDPSNADSRFDRNRLRLQVWPVLEAAFPGATARLAGAAAAAAEQRALAGEVAAADLPGVLDAGGGLLLAHWRRLPPARRANALRAWAAGANPGAANPALLLQTLGRELMLRQQGRWSWPGPAEVRLYRGRLSFGMLAEAVAKRVPEPADAAQHAALRIDELIDLATPGRWPVGSATSPLGHWQVAVCSAGGVAVATLRAVRMQFRHGGEQFCLAPRASVRSLKKQFQQQAIPAWERSAPLLFSAAGDLIFVPGLGVDARQRAAPGVPQMCLTWCPAGPASASTR